MARGDNTTTTDRTGEPAPKEGVDGPSRIEKPGPADREAAPGKEPERGRDAKIPKEELFSELHTSGDGLSRSEAEKRLAEHGPNEIVEKHRSPILRFFGYFWGPIPWMIEAAAVLSGITGDWTNLAIILLLLIMNAVVGFWEEYQADNTIEALKKQLAHKARVKRDGEWETIEAREIVPGDVIRLRSGDIIPADSVLLEGDTVEIDQSALTGESLPVERGEEELVYSGSSMKRGEITAVARATGEGTYFAKTARLTAEEGKKSHFQRAVLKIGDYLIVIAIVLVGLILVTALFRHDRMITVLRFTLVLTVAAIPVAMPTVLSVTMAVGARLLSKKQAVVRRLAAVEEIAGIDVLCSDKTGTLTKNELKLGDPWLCDGVERDDMAVAAGLASREEDQDPIDMAVLGALEDESELEGFEIEHFEPFDPVKKRTEATVRDKAGNRFKVSKGAPQMILDLAENKDAISEDVTRAIDEFAKHGYRSLGVARTDGDGKWRLLGIYPLYDPPRDDSRETIEAAKELGVQVKMVTGDQLAIAKEIARELGMGPNIVSASEFPGVEHHMKGQLADSIQKADGFAEVFPEHKYHIVETLQDRGHIVGMTGDGVNDAPALKKADAGIAVSGATDAARSAADIVLLAPGLSVIVDAIAQSRETFGRMNSYAIYRIAETIRVLLFMTLSILVFNFYPVTAVMIVLLALLNDGAILSIAFDRATGAKTPAAWNMRLVLGIASTLGLAGLAESFFLFYLAENYFHMPRDVIQSLIYLKLSVAGHLTVFVARTRGPFWSSRPSWILLLAVILTQALATVIAVYGFLMTPLGWTWGGLVWGYALLFFLVEDLVKRAAYRIYDIEVSGFIGRK